MPLKIEDYALIGDLHTAALVGNDGSIDWLCLPRFDSGACFAALLGTPEHGRWLLAPQLEALSVQRRYRAGSMILETDFVTAEGSVRVIDFMPLSDQRWDVIRVVRGLSGEVRMRMELVVRFDYGSIVPWVRRAADMLMFTAGPDTLELAASVAVDSENMKTRADFTVPAGHSESFVLNYRPSHAAVLAPVDASVALESTMAHWQEWSGRCSYEGRWREPVLRSLITLKALTYKPTGGLVAAPTTSLPEQPGSVRNWDYRYCWLRDATFTLNALLLAGYEEEAAAWQTWLLQAIAGSPQDLQILYSVTGVRRLDESELSWLPGYENSAPVRVGNAASKQYQLDVYGEVMDTLHLARKSEMQPHPEAWGVQRAILAFLVTHWQKPDEGIWEVRGPPRHFVHSKVMAWVAFDRAIKDAETYAFEAPLDEWREVRNTIHAQVCNEGFDAQLGSFVQAYGSQDLDASLLLIPQVGFLPADDVRVRGTVAAIERTLMYDGLVLRYATATNVDALPPGEGAFLACSFWLADALALMGRRDDAKRLFERLLALGNDVGLFAEEYDPRARRMLGNFPQALTHMALVNTARLLDLSVEEICIAGPRGSIADPPAQPSESAVNR